MAQISRDRNSSVSGTERVCGSGKGVEGLLEQSKTTGNVKKRPMFLLNQYRVGPPTKKVPPRADRIAATNIYSIQRINAKIAAAKVMTPTITSMISSRVI